MKQFNINFYTRNLDPYKTALTLLSLWLCVVGGLWVFDTMNLYIFPGIDTGQWIMYSRFYIGKTIPDYRVPLGVSPLYPFILGLINIALDNPILSMKLFAGVLFGLLGLTSYLVAKEIHDEVAGIMALYLTLFGQYLFVYMISFGGFPQLLSIIVMNIGFLFIVKFYKNAIKPIYYWIISISCLIVALSHYPSAPVYFISIFLSLLFICRLKKYELSDVIKIVLRSLALPILYWICYTIIFFKEEISYVSNIAGYHRRGIDELIHFFKGMSNNPTISLFFIFCLLGLIIISFWGSRKKWIVLLVIWFLTPVITILALYISKVGTDYPRFIFILIEPLIWSLSLYFSVLINPINIMEDYFSRYNSLQLFRRVRIGLLVLLIGIVSANSIFTFTIFPNALTFFSLNNEKDLQPVIMKISYDLDNRMIVSPFLESMWIEGLTGKPTLFSNQFRYLYRPGEIDRAISAFLLTNGNRMAIENGSSFVRFNNSSIDTMSKIVISFYTKGEYSDAFILQDNLINLSIRENGKDTLLNLDKDFSKCQSPIIYLTKQWISVKCEYYHNAGTFTIHMIKEILIYENDSAVVINFRADSKINKFILYYRDLPFNYIHGVADNTIPINSTYLSSIETYQNKAQIIRKEDDNNSIKMDILFNGGNTILSDPGLKDKMVYLKSETDNVRDLNQLLTIEILPIAKIDKLRLGLRIYNLQGIINKYKIGHLLIETSNKQALSLYNSLDLPIEYSNGDYVLYNVKPLINYKREIHTE